MHGTHLVSFPAGTFDSLSNLYKMYVSVYITTRMCVRANGLLLTPHELDSKVNADLASVSCPGSGTWATFKGSSDPLYTYCATVCSMRSTQLVSCDGWNAGGILDLHGLGIDHLPVAAFDGIAAQPTGMYVCPGVWCW